MPETKISILAVLKDRLSQPVKNNAKAFDGWKSAIEKTDKSLTSVIKKGAKLTSILGGLSAVGTAALGIKLAANAEKTALSFEVLLGSADAARKTLKDLDTFAATTPFQLPQLQEAARVLISYGTEADNVVGVMRRLGDVAAGTNSDIRDLARIFGRVQSTGRANNETLIQFAERGIPIYGELAKVMGVTVAEVRDLGSQGQIGITQISQAFENLTSEGGKFFNLTQRQSQTVAGLYSTLIDNLQKGLREFFLPFQGEFRSILSGGIEVLQNFNENILPQIVLQAKEILELYIKPAIPVVLEILKIAGLVLGAFVAWKVAIIAFNAAVVTATVIMKVLNGLALALNVLLSPATITMALIAAAALTIGAILTELTLQLSGQGGIKGALKDVLGVFEDLRKGTISFADILDAISTQFRVIGRSAIGFFVEPFIKSLALIGKFIGNVVVTGLKAVQLSVVELARTAITTVLNLIKSVAGLVDRFTKSIDKVVNNPAVKRITGGKGVSIATNLAGSISANTSGLDTLRNRLLREVQQGAKITQKTIADDLKSIADVNKKTRDDIEQLWKDYEKRVTDRAEKRKKTEADLGEFQKKQQKARRDREQKLLDQLERIRTNKNKEIQDRVLKAEIEALDKNLEERLISVEDYLKQRELLETTKTDERLAFLGKQLDLEKKLLEQAAKDGKSQESSLQRIVALELQIQKLKFDRRDITGKILEVQEKLAEAARKEAEARTDFNQDLKVRALRVVGLQREAERLELVQQQQKDLTEATREFGFVSGLSLFAIQQVELAQFDLDTQRERSKRFTKDLSILEKQYQKDLEETENLITTGSISIVEAFNRNAAALTRYQTGAKELLEIVELFIQKNPSLAADLQLIVAKLKAINNEGKDLGSTFNRFTNGFVQGVKQAVDNLNDFNELGQQLGQTLTQQFSTGITDAFESIIDGSKSAGDAFRDFAADTLRQIARLIIQFVVLRTISAAFGIPTFQSGGLVGIPGFAEGGTIPGPPSTRDNMLIMAQSGEYIARKSAVDHYGVGVFNALNKQLIPKGMLRQFSSSVSTIQTGSFQSGGQVMSSAPGSSGASPAIVVADEQTAEAILAGGRNAMLQFMEENKARIKGVLDS